MEKLSRNAKKKLKRLQYEKETRNIMKTTSSFYGKRGNVNSQNSINLKPMINKYGTRYSTLHYRETISCSVLARYVNTEKLYK